MEKPYKGKEKCVELDMQENEDLINDLEAAFNKKWIQNKVKDEINLGKVKEADEEKWSRNFIRKNPDKAVV
ncbi:hypothetical protein FRX31_033512 [Thalictrum thalictroides]|uniref:Uncharacterized protein n=1 Tax=Thalictrum thalictroides TaxID=46969 RepID=A0A7J6UXJ1_THATH|nr:hypothetical protein FRX31_033512 [Thalictrum thalictroides]